MLTVKVNGERFPLSASLDPGAVHEQCEGCGRAFDADDNGAIVKGTRRDLARFYLKCTCGVAYAVEDR